MLFPLVHPLVFKVTVATRADLERPLRVGVAQVPSAVAVKSLSSRVLIFVSAGMVKVMSVGRV
jgi:hypothetical protein